MSLETNISGGYGKSIRSLVQHLWLTRAGRLGLIISAAVSISSPVAAATVQPQLQNIADTAQREDRSRAERCLANAIAYEAGHESTEGKQAVAEVILNRARAKAYPDTVCGVVFEGSTRRTGCQFTFTCDGSLKRRLSSRVMTAAYEVAVAALDGRNPSRAAGATHYHADYVFPYWAPSLRRITKLGAHIFYRARAESSESNQADYVARSEPLVLALSTPPAAQTLAPAINPPVSNGPFAPWGLSVPIAGRQP